MPGNITFAFAHKAQTPENTTNKMLSTFFRDGHIPNVLLVNFMTSRTYSPDPADPESFFLPGAEFNHNTVNIISPGYLDMFARTAKKDKLDEPTVISLASCLFANILLQQHQNPENQTILLKGNVLKPTDALDASTTEELVECVEITTPKRPILDAIPTLPNAEVFIADVRKVLMNDKNDPQDEQLRVLALKASFFAMEDDKKNWDAFFGMMSAYLRENATTQHPTIAASFSSGGGASADTAETVSLFHHNEDTSTLYIFSPLSCEAVDVLINAFPKVEGNSPDTYLDKLGHLQTQILTDLKTPTDDGMERLSLVAQALSIVQNPENEHNTLGALVTSGIGSVVSYLPRLHNLVNQEHISALPYTSVRRFSKDNAVIQTSLMKADADEGNIIDVRTPTFATTVEFKVASITVHAVMPIIHPLRHKLSLNVASRDILKKQMAEIFSWVVDNTTPQITRNNTGLSLPSFLKNTLSLVGTSVVIDPRVEIYQHPFMMDCLLDQKMLIAPPGSRWDVRSVDIKTTPPTADLVLYCKGGMGTPHNPEAILQSLERYTSAAHKAAVIGLQLLNACSMYPVARYGIPLKVIESKPSPDALLFATGITAAITRNQAEKDLKAATGISAQKDDPLLKLTYKQLGL